MKTERMDDSPSVNPGIRFDRIPANRAEPVRSVIDLHPGLSCIVGPEVAHPCVSEVRRGEHRGVRILTLGRSERDSPSLTCANAVD